MSDTDPILVAVDGSPADEAAVRYAAAEAARLGADLQTLHVMPGFGPLAALTAPTPGASTAEVEAAAKAIVARAVAVAHEVLPRGRVSARLTAGDAVLVILEAAVRARVVVLGADRAGLLRRIAVGSTVGNVAARSSAPAVTVPADWHQPAAPQEVLVALKRYDAAPLDLVRAAAAHAAAHAAPLRLVHVWELPETYGDLLLAVSDFPQWAATVERRLRHEVAPALADFPQVAVEVSIRYGQPANVLKELSADAELLVIARREQGSPWGHFGSTGRALLRESSCPVEVLPLAEIAAP